MGCFLTTGFDNFRFAASKTFFTKFESVTDEKPNNS